MRKKEHCFCRKCDCLCRKSLLKLRSKYRKVTGYKLLYKSPLLCCTLAMNNWNLKIIKTIPFAVILKNIYTCINLTKYVYNLIVENNKAVMK